MSRPYTITVVTIIALTLVASPAFADGLRVDTGSGTLQKRLGDEQSQDSSTDSGATPVRDEDGPHTPSTLVRELREVEDDEHCDVLVRREIGPGETVTEIQHRAQSAWMVAYGDIDPASYTGLCEGQDEVELDSDDILAIVRDQLPRPEPRIEPGYGLTGMPAYLETNRPLEYDETLSQTIQGLTLGIEVRATGGYEVDWGDGTVTGPHATAGQPHPHGEITHVYGDAGTYDVAVTDTWQLEWRYLDSPWFPAFEATLDPVVLEDFTVRQAQSVRTTAG